MHFSARALPTSLPPLRPGQKPTTAEDIVALLRVIEGRDTAWQFLEVRQIDEIKRNVERVIPAQDRSAALQDGSPNTKGAKTDGIEQIVKLERNSRKPLLGQEICAVLDAKERQTRWDARRARGFEDAPLALRLLLNARVRTTSKRLNDLPSSATCQLLKDGVTTAIVKGWIGNDPGNLPTVSDEARDRLSGCIRASLIRPIGIESVAPLYDVSPSRIETLGAKMAEVAGTELEFYLRGKGSPTRKTGESQHLVGATVGELPSDPIVQHSLEVLSARHRYPREEVIRAMLRGFEECAKPNLQGTGIPARFSHDVASHFVPNARGIGIINGGDLYVRTVCSVLKGLSEGFSAWVPMFKELLRPRYREGAWERGNAPGVQREVLSVAGSWLARPEVPTEVKGELQKILLRETSPLNPRMLIETAMFWIREAHALFPTEKLRRVTLPMLASPDREYLYHSLYISARGQREEGKPDTLGALEMVIGLIKERRFGTAEGVEAYRSAGILLLRRKKDLGNGLWHSQQAEGMALMEELDRLCGGEPKRVCGAELERAAEESRQVKNEKCKESVKRRQRVHAMAGDFLARKGRAA